MARFLGIDIGDTALRGALIRTGLRKMEVERYVEIPLTEGKNAPGRLPELAEAGKNLLRALPAAPDAVIAAVAGEVCSLRALELPLAAKKRAAEVIPFELEALLPYEPSDAIIDYQSSSNAPDSVRVLVAAALRKHVSETIAGYAQTGFSPRELAAGAAALDGLPNVLPELREEGPFLLLDMADHRSDLCFLYAGLCVMARTIAIGIEDMPGAAEELRNELSRTLAGFRTAGFETPKRIFLCGIGASAEGAIDWLSSALMHPVERIELPAATAADTRGRPEFAKPLALAGRAVLARRRINLRSGEFAPESTRGGLADHLNLIITCAVIVVMTMMFSLKSHQMLLADEQTALRSQLAAATQQVFDKPIEDAAEAERQIMNPKSNDPLPRFDAFDALAALSGSIPPEVKEHEVRRLRIEIADEKRDGRLELQGLLPSLTQRDQVVADLQKQGCFRDFKLGKTGPAPGGGSDRISYQIEAMVQCEEEAPKKKTGATQPKESLP